MSPIGLTPEVVASHTCTSHTMLKYILWLALKLAQTANHTIHVIAQAYK